MRHLVGCLPFDSARLSRASLRVLAALALLALAGQASTASLTVTQIQTPAPVAGSPVRYLIVVENTGPTITDLIVTDTVSPVLTGLMFDQPGGLFTAPVVSNVAPSGTLVAWTAGSLAMVTGEIYTFTITGTVGRVCPPVTVTATAYAWGTDGIAPGESSDGESFTLTFAPVIVVGQSPASPGPGTLVTYTITVGNQGQVTLENIIVVDTVGPALVNPQPNLPPGFTVTAVVSGPNTIFTWTGTGFGPNLPDIVFTVTGTVGSVCLPLSVTNTGFLHAESACSTLEYSASTAWSFDPGAVSPPSGLGFIAGDTWAVIGWPSGDEGVEFINRYHVWRSADGGATSTFAGTTWVDASVNPFTATDTRMFWDRGLTNGVAYSYVVQAITGCVTAYSAPVAVTPTAPVPPIGMVFTSPGDGYIKLAWRHPAVVWSSPPFPNETKASIYKIFRATTAGGPWPATETVRVTNIGDYIDQPLANLYPYYYMVVPCCPDRIPSYTFDTPYRPASGQGIPGARTDASGPRAVRVFWGPAAVGDYVPLLGYRVYRSDDGGKSLNLVSGVTPIPVTQFSFLDTVPGYGKQYVYIIRPVDSQGNNGIAYQTVLIFVAIPTNRLYLNHNQFRPARNEVLSVIFQITEPGRTRVSVFTPTGERVRTLLDLDVPGNFTPDSPFNARDRGLPPLIWDGTNERGELVSSGAYLLVLEINKGRDFRTIVVIR